LVDNWGVPVKNQKHKPYTAGQWVLETLQRRILGQHE